MTRPTTFAIARDDRGFGWEYVIGGRPLSRRLEAHERIAYAHMPALGGCDGARARLLLEAPPDLVEGATALYVCGMCGGYDGDPIGARIRIEGERVVWDRIGHYADCEDLGPSRPFERVRSFTFDLAEYREALRTVPTS